MHTINGDEVLLLLIIMNILEKNRCCGLFPPQRKDRPRSTFTFERILKRYNVLQAIQNKSEVPLITGSIPYLSSTSCMVSGSGMFRVSGSKKAATPLKTGTGP